MSRRPLIAAAGAVLALSGLVACGDDETGESEADSTTRVVEGAYGEIEIPSEPKRIFADLMTVDYLTALDYDTSSIVGVFGGGWYAGEEDHYLHDQVSREGLVDPGFAFEANLEEVAAADPDLILVPFDQIDGVEIKDQLAEIAPLLAVPTSESTASEERYAGTASFQDWRGTLRAYGTLLDREDEAAAYIAESEEMLAELRAEHGDMIDSLGVVQAKSTPDYVAITPLSTDQGALGSILLNEIGFRQPEQLDAVEPDEWGTIEISEENTSLLDGDLLFLEVRESSKEHEKSPLWATLDVVQNGGVVIVGNHWEFGGAVGAREVIEDVDATLDNL
jgi:iron complex transport system substrate-binding protein